MLFFEAASADHTGTIQYSIDRALDQVYIKTEADGYRLPDTVEFNVIADGDGKARYSWGDDPVGVFDHAWLFDNSGGTTHPVARKKSNPLGLYDVEGNVSELLMGRPPKWDVFGSATCPRAGGSFIDLTVGLRPDKPPFSPSGWGYPDTGFRVVRQVPEQFASASGGAVNLQDGLGLAVMAAHPGRDRLQMDPNDYDDLQGRVYRGNLRRDGTFDARGLSGLKGLKWRFRTGDPVRSSPVVVDGVAYFGSLDGNVYAVDAETGGPVWKFTTGGPVTGSAAAVGGTVYMASEDGSVYALNIRNGQQQWKTDLTGHRPHGNNRLAGSPAVACGIVFISAGNRGGHDTVYMTNGPTVGLDARTGEQVWESPWGTQGYGSPTIRGDELFCSDQNWWAAVDLASGQVKWRLQLTGQSRDFVTGVLGEDLTYGVGSMGGDIICGRPADRWRVWHGYSRPYQVPITTGGELGHEVLAPPALAHGRLYVGNNDGKLRTFDARTGERGWEFETGDKIQSAPSVAGGVLYFGCHDGRLYALDALSGEPMWDFQAGAPIVSSPWPTCDAVYFGCDNGYLYAVE
jgi:outer membrane protein assembly factor BamB